MLLVELSAPSFDDLLAEPRRSSTLTTASLVFDAGPAVHYRLSTKGRGTEPVEEDESGGRVVLVGLQAGQAFAPVRSAWKLDEIDSVASGPELGGEGSHVRFTLGGWGG